jgi:hypothetical protein
MPRLHNEDDLLFHYTSGAGLKGILETSAFFATDVQFMNDTQELVGAIKFLRDWVEERSAVYRDARTRPQGVPEIAADRWEYITSMADATSNERSLDMTQAFAVSFCEDGDLLSQWRGYAAADGYALGFDRNLLATAITSAVGEVQLAEVSYGAPAAGAFDELERFIAAPTRELIYAGVRAFRASLPILVRIKDPAFKEEKEHRLLTTTSDLPEGVEFRHNGERLVPFVRFQWPAHALRAIRVGPGRDQALRRRSAYMAGRSFARGQTKPDGTPMDFPTVTFSDAPYRG